MPAHFLRRRTRRRRGSVATAVVAALVVAGFAGSAPSGASDNLDHRQHSLSNRIDSQQTDIDEISTSLLDAQSRLDTAVGDLAGARLRLSDLRGRVTEAVAADTRMQQRLAQAVVRLDNARSDLSRGRGDVDAKRAELTGYAESSYQSGGLDVYNLGIALDSGTAQQAVDSMQDVDAALSKQTVALQQLQAMQVLLSLTEQRVRSTKMDVSKQRRDAAANLVLRRTLEREAQVAETEVQTRVSNLRSDRQRLASAKGEEMRRLHALETERQQVEDRLRQIAERRAARHQVMLAAAPPATAPATTAPSTTTATTNDGGYLSYPVLNSYITSPYGMRMHPILHVWKLHDGTDFSAACGTPVYAAADGTVMDEYYNEGYGNRVIVDHGFVKGASLSTSYNHLTSFVAHVGDHVSRGQIVAYSGTTGYSTGCHLHFMVYVNGVAVDPMTWL